MNKYVVEYISRYLGWGVNKIEREYYENENEAYKRVEELEKKSCVGVKVYSIDI